MKPKHKAGYKVGDLVQLNRPPAGSGLYLVTRVRRRPGVGVPLGYVLLTSGGNEYEMDVGSWDEEHSSLVQKM
jgi:hypothetical protein